jgi:hypothetical protein
MSEPTDITEQCPHKQTCLRSGGGLIHLDTLTACPYGRRRHVGTSTRALDRAAKVVLDNHRVIRDGSLWFCPRCGSTWPGDIPIPSDVTPCHPRSWI